MATPDKIVVVSGGFDPLHSGHLDMIDAAREIGRVIVALNSDDWLVRKKGKAFMPFQERARILKALRNVMAVISFDDSDDSARDALKQAKELFPNSQICFANGGDRDATNIPEMDVKDVLFLFGVGGESKANSSSWILEAWKAERTDRSWGHYEVLRDLEGAKVKTLTVKPHQCLSHQRHFERDEHWVVTSGYGVAFINKVGYELYPGAYIHVPAWTWHQIYADDNDLVIVEIQRGENCVESDIERKP
jgi:cytidyltransferase-like protein